MKSAFQVNVIIVVLLSLIVSLTSLTGETKIRDDPAFQEIIRKQRAEMLQLQEIA